MAVERLSPQAQAVIARRRRCPQCNRMLKRTLYSQGGDVWGYRGEGFCTMRHGYEYGLTEAKKHV